MILYDTDWNEIWNRMAELRRPGPENPEAWNRKADGFRKRARSSAFTEKLLPILDLQPDDRVLDIGSGEGTITLPIAKRVQSVTAMDYSSRMLELLAEDARENGIVNVKTVEGEWDSDWEKLIKPEFDICLASRSFLVKDLAHAIDQLNRFAKRKVYVITAAGESAGSTPARKIVGRGDHPSPDYIIAVNELYRRGILCEVRFISLENTTTYETREDAFNWLRLSLPEISTEEEKKLHDYVMKSAVLQDGRWILQPRKPVQWAVLSWAPPAEDHP